MRDLESDMLLLFSNARKFDTFANDPANRFVTEVRPLPRVRAKKVRCS